MAARILYVLIAPFYREKMVRAERSGIQYLLDLREGIDFSIFLFGNFQKSVTSSSFLPEEIRGNVIDVGANMGAITLNFAKRIAGEGHLWSFEPTDYAHQKLITNVGLNPGLECRISVIKAFVSDRSAVAEDHSIYSSWKINRSDAEAHAIHGGTPMPAADTPSITLDDDVTQNQIENIKLIKIDTDGHEHLVLAGAAETIRKQRPVVVFEAGLYLTEGEGRSFTDTLRYFHDADCRIFETKHEREVTDKNYPSIVPAYSTVDLIAVPK